MTDRTLFISHSHKDVALADALSDAVTTLFGGAVTVAYSTKRGDGGIPVGTDWLRWIAQQVNASEYVVLMLTPNFLSRPSWLLWEAGAVYGATLASPQKLLPLRFGVDSERLPKPLAATNLQSARGDDAADMKPLFENLIQIYAKDDVRLAVSAGGRLSAAVDTYIESVTAALSTTLPADPPEDSAAQLFTKAMELAIIALQAFRPDVRVNGRYFFASVDAAGSPLLVRAEDVYVETIALPAEFTFDTVDVRANADILVICRSFLDRVPIYRVLSPELREQYDDDLRRHISEDQQWVLACPVLVDRIPVGVVCLYGGEPPARDNSEARNLERVASRVSEVFSRVLGMGAA